MRSIFYGKRLKKVNVKGRTILKGKKNFYYSGTIQIARNLYSTIPLKEFCMYKRIGANKYA